MAGTTELFIFSAVDVHESLPGKMGLVSLSKRTLTLPAQTQNCGPPLPLEFLGCTHQQCPAEP